MPFKLMPFTSKLACLVLLLSAGIASADTHPDSHAPISVMGDHTHSQGEFMLGYRAMHMSMQGNRDGTSSISSAEIASSAANPFGAPPTLRVVPEDMTMTMHMVSAMYAPSDRVTLMGMLNYTTKEMDHTTFAGPSGTNVLGGFTTKTGGMGDTSLAALIRLGDTHHSKWHVTLGLSLPTGDIEETDDILTPMNTRPSPRLPYPMQLGSGTYDLVTGFTYSSNADRWGWGSQWRSLVHLGENDEDYTLGDEHKLQGWLSYRINPSLSVSARLAYLDRGNIDGMDPLINAPVQTADPDRHGMQRLDFGLGANVLLPGQKQRLALEVTAPVYQKLNGPQLETDWVLTFGWQYTP